VFFDFDLDCGMWGESLSTSAEALTPSACAQLPPVNLRSTALFSVLAGSTVTNTGPTRVIGDLGVSPGTAVTGFCPGRCLVRSTVPTRPQRKAKI
jgi:hypothetical protein